MTVEGLPEGLLSNKEGVQPADEGDDRVEAEQVAYLWRGIGSIKNTHRTSQLIVCRRSLRFEEDGSGGQYRPETGEFLLAHLEQ